MKLSVKTLTICTCFFLSQLCQAQLKMPFSPNVAQDVKKVIDDYPNRFINIMGEIQSQQSQSIQYRCNFEVAGAEEAFVIRYPAKKDVCSWEALMITTENFDKAKNKFRNLYTQLNNLGVNIGKTQYKLHAAYESPEESMKFTSIVFSLTPALSTNVENMKIEISMQYKEPMEWQVKLLVYDKEREDDERGNIIED